MSPSQGSLQWLLVLPFVPRPDHASGDRRLAAMMEMLAPECTLSVVCLTDRGESDRVYVERLTATGVRFVGYGFAAAATLLIRQAFDAILFEFWFTTDRLRRLARQLQPKALIVVDTVDVHYLREREAARLGTLSPASAEQTRILELTAYRSADVTIVVSDAEGNALAEEGISDVVVVPNIVQQVSRSARARGNSVLFVGGFDHAPNGMAVEWFHREIWPLVRREVTDATWVIAGSNAPPAVRALDGVNGVTVAGFVPSTAALLDDTAVSIAPLTFGGGMKGKVSEALAAGVPVVTTRWGAQGFESGAGEAFVLADDPQDFAAAIVALFRDTPRAEAMGTRGRALAQRLCSIESATPGLKSLVQRSASSRRRESLLRRGARLIGVALERGIARMQRRISARTGLS